MSSLAITSPAPALASAEAWVLNVLEEHLGVSGLELAAPLTTIPNGWETYTLSLQLAPTLRIPRAWQRPLILRAYSSMSALSRARHEHATQEYVRRLGFPAPRSLALVERPSPWGGPVRFMERIEGCTMLEAIEANPFRLWNLPREMGKVHARLHQLPTEGLGLRRSDLFTIMASVIEDHELTGLAPGLDWLMENQPPACEQESIAHFDFHPLNVLCRPNSELTILDWADTEISDPDADVGATCLLLECGPTEHVSAWTRWGVPLARAIVLRRYLHAYQQLRPLDLRRLTYFRAWAALRRLCNYSRWLYGGCRVTGTKPSAVDHLTPEYLGQLCAYFKRWSRVAIRLP